MTKHQQLKHNQLIDKKCKAAIFLSVGLVMALTLVKMVSSNRAATWGHNLDQIKQETLTLKQANARLETELAQKTGGLTNLAKVAEKQGFVSNPKIKFFAPGSQVAQILP